MLKFSLKSLFFSIIFSIILSISADNINLVKSGNFDNLKTNELQKNWKYINYNTNGELRISQNRPEKGNVLLIKLTSPKDKIWLRQYLKKSLPQGTLVRLSCKYKTNDYLPKRYNSLFLQLTYSGHIKGSPSNRLYLSASPEWKLAEQTFITSEKCYPAISLFAQKGSGKIFIREIKVELLKQNSKPNDSHQYFWREAEDCFKARRATVSKWKPEILKYSGNGAISSDKSELKWKFFTKKIIDQKSLTPKSVKYHLWLRIYGYLDKPLVKVSFYDKNNKYQKVTTFQTVPNEKKGADGKYKGPGKFYWQYAGSFITQGGINQLVITPKSRFFADAVFISDDINCRPYEFELKKYSEQKSDSFKTIKNEEKVFIDTSYSLFGVTDCFVTPLNFWIFPQKGFNTKRTKENPAYAYFALPEWLDLKGISSHWASQTHKTPVSAGLLKLTKVKQKKFDGFTYNVYRTPVYYLYSWISLFVKGSKGNTPFGQRQKVYFWLEDGDFKNKIRQMSIQAVNLKKNVKQFKNIFIGPMGGHHNFLQNYPQLPEILKYCGFNIINTWGTEQLASRGQTKQIKSFIKACNRLNISVIDELSPGYKYWKEKPVRPINRKGEKDKSGLALYLNSESPYIKRMQLGIKNIVRTGISGLTMDDEVFNHANDNIDFSDQTKKLFKIYLKKKHHDLNYIDPLKIVENKHNLKKLYQAWIDFRCSRTTSWYKLYRQAYNEAMTKYSPDSTFGRKYLIPVIVNGRDFEKYKRRVCLNLKDIAQYATHISPMIYTYSGIKSSGVTGDSIKRFQTFTGLKKNIITPTLLGGHRGFGEIPYIQRKMVKYEIYESLINQSPGMFFWVTSGTMNPLILEQIMIAIETTVQYENFFVKGKRINVSVTPKALKADALKLGNKIVIYISNYKLSKEISATIKLPVSKIIKVIDLETGKSNMFSKDEITVNFNKERGRLLLIECSK